MMAIDDIVQTGLPDYPGLCIRPYGSYVSGLYSPSGDLDLSIEGTPTGGYAALHIREVRLAVAPCSRAFSVHMYRDVSPMHVSVAAHAF